MRTRIANPSPRSSCNVEAAAKHEQTNVSEVSRSGVAVLSVGVGVCQRHEDPCPLDCTSLPGRRGSCFPIHRYFDSFHGTPLFCDLNRTGRCNPMTPT